MSGKNTGKILSLIFVRKSKDKETFSAPDFLTLYYRSSPFEMSSIYEAANRNRNFSIAFFSIRDTYERLMPSRAATCFCVYSAFPPRPYRRRSTCFPALLIPNPDNSTAAPRPLSGCTVPRYPPRRPLRCRADGSHFLLVGSDRLVEGNLPCRFLLLRRYISSSLSIQRAAYAASRFPFSNHMSSPP